MSLIVNSGSSTTMEPIEEGTHLGVCFQMIDLGMQYSETFKNSSRKILIGWEIPDETYERDGEKFPRTISKTYTASLNENAKLREDLEAWRGKAFTPEELAGFDLRKIVGKSCLLNIVHTERGDKVYANVGSVMSLMRGMKPGELSEPPIIYDIDDDPVEKVDDLPKWISDTIKKSVSYQEKLNAKPTFTEVTDDGELPF